MVTRIFSNVASVIMDINTGALMFLNVYISRSRYNECYLSDNCCWEQHFYSLLCIPPTAVQVHKIFVLYFAFIDTVRYFAFYRQCTNKLRLCFQVKTDHAACTVKLQQLLIKEMLLFSGWSTLTRS
ncbi:hypothetical protein T08_10337 [Trichinella sp. T8]|nr:hypothetical protein T08_10337 [Trichinella sp. T8]